KGEEPPSPQTPLQGEGLDKRDIPLPDGGERARVRGEDAGGRTITRQVDLGTMPLYVRAGAIIPIDPIRQYTAQPIAEPTTLRIYSGADGEYTLYADDGISQEYVAGRGTWIRMTWNDRVKRLTLEPGAPKGATNLPTKRTFRVQLLPAAAAEAA